LVDSLDVGGRFSTGSVTGGVVTSIDGASAMAKKTKNRTRKRKKIRGSLIPYQRTRSELISIIFIIVKVSYILDSVNYLYKQGDEGTHVSSLTNSITHVCAS
jgi:hypothetical protein